MSRGASGISEGGDSRAGGRSSWIRSRLTPNRSSSLVIHIFATTPPSSTHHLAREDRPRDVLRPPIFYQIFRPPDFHENSTRSSPSILKIKLSIDRYENEVPLHHHSREEAKATRCREPVSPIEKKRKNRATNYCSARTIAHFLGNSSTPCGKMGKKLSGA